MTTKILTDEIKTDEMLENPSDPFGLEEETGAINNTTNIENIINTVDDVVSEVERGVQMVCVDFTTDVTTGDGKFYFHIDEALDGKKLFYVNSRVITAGSTNTTDVMIANVTTGLDMLTSPIRIDSGETSSATTASPPIINTSRATVQLNDLIRVDVDAVSTTAPKGLIVTLDFR